MRPEVAQSLFHGNASISTEGTCFEKGTGLGLALCSDYLNGIAKNSLNLLFWRRVKG